MPSNFFPWDTASITDVEHYTFLAWIEAIATVLLCWDTSLTLVSFRNMFTFEDFCKNCCWLLPIHETCNNTHTYTQNNIYGNIYDETAIEAVSVSEQSYFYLIIRLAAAEFRLTS